MRREERESCSSRRPGFRPSRSSSCSASSSSACSPTAPTRPTPRSPSGSSIRRARRLQRRRDPSGPEGLPRATGSWSTARSSATAPTWALTTPPTTCAARRSRSQRQLGGPDSDRAGSRLSRTSRPIATTRTRETLELTAEQAVAHSRSSSAITGDFFSNPGTEFGLRPETIKDPEAVQRPNGVLRLGGVGDLGPEAGAQLLVHEQLAPRAPGRQRADRQRRRLVGRLPDRAARGDRPPVRRLRPLELPRLARARAGDPHLPHTRRRGADPGAAGVRLVLPGDGRALPACRRWSAPPPSTTGPTSRVSSASTSPRRSRSTWCAPGTCSSRSSSSRPRSSRPGSSWRR